LIQRKPSQIEVVSLFLFVASFSATTSHVTLEEIKKMTYDKKARIDEVLEKLCVQPVGSGSTNAYHYIVCFR